VVDDEPLDGYDRIYASDPFGNRIELLEPLPRSPQESPHEPAQEPAHEPPHEPRHELQREATAGDSARRGTSSR
jgi:hypothetical protein